MALPYGLSVLSDTVGMRTASPDNPWPHEPQLRNNKSNGKENGNYRDYRVYIGDI